MDSIKFEQSAKNIPIHTKKTYQQSLINSFEKFVCNLRFKSHFFLNPNPNPQKKENEFFKPYIKPGDTPLYVNSNSNHPPSVVKNIPAGINRRLSTISSNKQFFDKAASLPA